MQALTRGYLATPRLSVCLIVSLRWLSKQRFFLAHRKAVSFSLLQLMRHRQISYRRACQTHAQLSRTLPRLPAELELLGPPPPHDVPV
jgi:hypothetical protein